MAAGVEIIGVYRVGKSPEPVSLIELWVKDCSGPLDLMHFCQRHPELGTSKEQVAYLEHVLDGHGKSGAPPASDPAKITGNTRVAFFIHYLDARYPVETPFGPVILPAETRRPKRLAFIKYTEVL